MAINLDRNLLDELGLGGLPDSEKSALLSHIYETLEMRVGMRLADQMTEDQLNEFEKYFEAKDDAGAFHWLETNFPNYKDIVQDEFNKLKEEVKQSAPQILQASQQQDLTAEQMPQQQPNRDSGNTQYQQPIAQPPYPPQSNDTAGSNNNQPLQHPYDGTTPPPQPPTATPGQ